MSLFANCWPSQPKSYNPFFLLYYVPSMIIIWFFSSFQLFGSILESFRKDFNLASQTHIILFPYFLYPINQVAISGKKVYTDMYYVFAFAWCNRLEYLHRKSIKAAICPQYPQNQNVCLTKSYRETLQNLICFMHKKPKVPFSI